MTQVRSLILCLCSLLLAACAAPTSFVSPNAPLGSADIQRIHLATDRVLTRNLAGTTLRAGVLSFAQYDITIPPGHEPGKVEFSGTDPDPAESFTVAQARPISGLQDFGRKVRAQSGPSRRPLDGTVVYVHGFNTSLEHAVLRHAQIAKDYDLPGPQVTFAWPSIQRTAGYVRDKDSILIARDHLEELLMELTRNGEEIVLFGHSMGTELVVETLRQLSIAGRTDVLRQISGVILISPDIDMDLFEAQHERIEPLPQPFIIMTTRRDYALRVSALLTAQPERLGSARDLQRLSALDLLVLDLSGLPESRNHFLTATSPEVIELVNRMREGTNAPSLPSRGVIDMATWNRVALN